MDASVAIKWLIPEDDQPRALYIRQSYQEGALHVIAPGLITAEIGNVLWKYAMRGLLSAADADRALARFQQDSPILKDSPSLNATALRLALRYRRTFSDSLYLALAMLHQCDLITADERLVRSMQPAFPSVHLLREYVSA